MTELDMVMQISELKGKVNYLTKLLSEIKWLISLHPELKEDSGFKNILEVLDKNNIKRFYELNWD